MITKLNTLQNDDVLNAETINEMIGGINGLIDEIVLLKTQNSSPKFIIGTNPIENADAYLSVGNGISPSSPNTLLEVSTNNILLNNKVNLQGLETKKELENKDLMSYLNFLEDRIIALEHSVNGWIETIKEEGKEDKKVKHKGLTERTTTLEGDLLDTYKDDGETLEKKGMISQVIDLLDDWDIVKGSLIKEETKDGETIKNNILEPELEAITGLINTWKGSLDTPETGVIALANDYKDHKSQMTETNNFYTAINNVLEYKNQIEELLSELETIGEEHGFLTASNLSGVLFKEPPEDNSVAKNLVDKINELIADGTTINSDNPTTFKDMLASLQKQVELIKTAVSTLHVIDWSEENDVEGGNG